MNSLSAVLADAGRLRTKVVGESGYALVYGSHACRPTLTDSDLDLLYVGAPLREERREGLTDAVVAMHRDHGLHLDTEVAYEVKLHASLTEVDQALALRGFTVDADGRLSVAPVVAEPWFLNSHRFKLRLILNALTTSHIFLGGAIDLYLRHCVDADRALGLVALSLLDDAGPFTVADAVNALVVGPDGAAGEDYLGYAFGPALHSTVQRGLAHLVTNGLVSSFDGVGFHQDCERRRRAVANQYGPASTILNGPETITA